MSDNVSTLNRRPLLHGAAAIGAYLGLTPKQLNRRRERDIKRVLPVFKLGGTTLAAYPDDLDAYVELWRNRTLKKKPPDES